mmetsp:Transcript_31298/g.59540  ORF Transcript_31298/g.59540 Transcript_31298/m.59540 type:complete len:249 (+) Transcript_31298:423-1169(+)
MGGEEWTWILPLLLLLLLLLMLLLLLLSLPEAALFAWEVLLVRLSFGGVSADSVGTSVVLLILMLLLLLLLMSSSSDAAVAWTDNAIRDSSRLFGWRPMRSNVEGDASVAATGTGGGSGSRTNAVGRRTSSAREPREETSSPKGWKWAGVPGSLRRGVSLALFALLVLPPPLLVLVLTLYIFFMCPLSLLLRLKLLETSTIPKISSTASPAPTPTTPATPPNITPVTTAPETAIVLFESLIFVFANNA